MLQMLFLPVELPFPPKDTAAAQRGNNLHPQSSLFPFFIVHLRHEGEGTAPSYV